MGQCCSNVRFVLGLVAIWEQCIPNTGALLGWVDHNTGEKGKQSLFSPQTGCDLLPCFTFSASGLHKLFAYRVARVQLERPKPWFHPRAILALPSREPSSDPRGLAEKAAITQPWLQRIQGCLLGLRDPPELHFNLPSSMKIFHRE